MKNDMPSKKISKGLVGALAIASGSAAYGNVVVVAPPSPDIAPSSLPTSGPIEINWDVDGDSIIDFTIGFEQAQDPMGFDWQAYIYPALGNFVIGTPPGIGLFFYAHRFSAGDSIGPVTPTGTSLGGSPINKVILGSNFSGNDYGEFLPPNSRGFVGFQFLDGANNTVYGYLELQVNRSPSAGSPGIQFLSAAYETTPLTAIEAGATAVPEPGTLAMLAFGAAALLGAEYRRRSNRAASAE